MKTSFCIICGEAIKERRAMGRGKNYPICRNSDCLEMYQNLKKSARLPIADKYIDPDAFNKKKETEQHDGFCGRCGKPIRIDLRHYYLRHGTSNKCDKAPTTRNPQQTIRSITNRPKVFGRSKPKPKPRIYLKPWQDPQSLFCDTEFLETEILYKKIRTGEECKDKL